MIEKFIITPFQKFARIESFSGILLFIVTIAALIIANSPLYESYSAIWNYKIGIKATNFELVKPVILWINDGLMAIFFFLIGLEIKRELLIGELNSFKKASFPIFAAIGGMLIPISFFLLINNSPESVDGWAIPMATDIAFSLAILKLLGKRAPLSLKIFLTAFAIVDDLGAVITIALFYSASIKWNLILIALVLLSVLFFLSYKRIYSRYVLTIFGIAIWVLFLKSGIHPTIAGVLVALAVPIRQKIYSKAYYDNLCELADNFKANADLNSLVLTKVQIEQLDEIEDISEKVQSPLQHLEHKLHTWVAYLIMPIFAFSNAGVNLTSSTDINFQLSIIIAISMVAGNFIGVVSMSLLSIKLKLAELPKGIELRQIIGVGFLAGVGFTMSIFIANLAYSSHPELLDSAKVGILLGSILAGITGYLILRK